MDFVQPASLPAPRGHYSPAVIHHGVIYISGQLPLGADGLPDASAPFEAQVRRVLEQIRAILEAAGSRPTLVLRATVYLVDVARWGALNALYAEFFGAHRPARTVVPVPALHDGCLVEIDVVAALDEAAR